MNYRFSPSACESSAESEVSEESQSDRDLNKLAGHGRDPTRLQLSLFDQKQSEPSPSEPTTERVLGGVDDTTGLNREKRPPSTLFPGCGWIEFHPVRRKRKNGDVWGNETGLAALGRERTKEISVYSEGKVCRCGEFDLWSAIAD